MVTACRGRIRSSSQRSRATGSLGALGEAVCPAPCDPAAGPGSGSRGGVGFPTAGLTPGWKPSRSQRRCSRKAFPAGLIALQQKELLLI